ncbi:hypothetical protein BHM03_00055368 [Ensete ventricosum]|nr:hypothetical protein BHM03_00055368 [Ensete ventricosum]
MQRGLVGYGEGGCYQLSYLRRKREGTVGIRGRSGVARKGKSEDEAIGVQAVVCGRGGDDCGEGEGEGVLWGPGRGRNYRGRGGRLRAAAKSWWKREGKTLVVGGRRGKSQRKTLARGDAVEVQTAVCGGGDWSKGGGKGVLSGSGEGKGLMAKEEDEKRESVCVCVCYQGGSRQRSHDNPSSEEAVTAVRRWRGRNCHTPMSRKTPTVSC